jgi:RNA polymerase sigma-70 factor (ECF subfamily)
MPAADPQPKVPNPAESAPEAAALEALYRAEAPWLIRFFARELRNITDAQDLAHETMLRFIRNGSATDLRSSQAYLRRIATNLMRDRVASGPARLARLTSPLIAGLDQEVGIDQHQIVAGRQELAHWETILSKLKPRTLEIFLLGRVDGLTYNQIATTLDMTIWNVKRHMLIAIRHVARHRGDR